MTKISIDSASWQQERQSRGLSDLARRFEWRLQWEKNQFENRQVYTQAKVSESGLGSTLSENIVQQDVTMKDAQIDQYFISNDHSTAKVDIAQQQECFTAASSTKYVRAAVGAKSTVNMLTAIAPTAVNNMTNFSATNQHEVSQFCQNRPSVVTACALTPGVHIYKVNNSVEIAFRSSNFTQKDGLKIIDRLKKDLFSLGLSLTRLTLNGELFWQSQSNESQTEDISSTDSDSLEKIY